MCQRCVCYALWPLKPQAERTYETKPQYPRPTLDACCPCVSMCVRMQDGPPLDTSHISSLQLMLSKFEYDGALNPSFKTGEFELPIAQITTYQVSARVCVCYVRMRCAGVAEPVWVPLGYEPPVAGVMTHYSKLEEQQVQLWLSCWAGICCCHPLTQSLGRARSCYGPEGQARNMRSAQVLSCLCCAWIQRAQQGITVNNLVAVCLVVKRIPRVHGERAAGPTQPLTHHSTRTALDTVCPLRWSLQLPCTVACIVTPHCCAHCGAAPVPQHCDVASVPQVVVMVVVLLLPLMVMFLLHATAPVCCAGLCPPGAPLRACVLCRRDSSQPAWHQCRHGE